MKKIATLVALSALSTFSSAFSAQRDAGTSESQFLKIGVGNPKALALGRSYVALADGVQSLGFNPAGLATSNSREFAVGISEWIDGFKGHYLAYGHPHMRSNFGFNIAYFSLGDFDVRDENGLPISGSNVFVRTGFANLAFAWSLPTENFSIGTGLKTIFEDYSGNSTYRFRGDVGVLWRKDSDLQLGASFLNLGPKSQEVPWSARGGVAYKFFDYLTGTWDVIQDRDTDLRMGLGADINLPTVAEFGVVSLRLGYYTADDQGESSLGILKTFKLHRTSGISFGLGLETESETLYNMTFDYALVPLGALGTTHHVALKFSF